MKRYGLLAAVMALLTVITISPAACALLNPLINHGVIDLHPYGNDHEFRSSTFWKNRVYLSGHPADCSDPIFCVNVSNPDNPTFAASGGRDGCYFNQLTVVEDKLYVAGWGTMLRTFDVSDPSRITYLGQYDRPDGGGKSYYAWGLDVQNNRVYLIENAEQSEGVYFIDVTNPANPTPISWMDQLPLGGMGGVAAKGSYLYFGNNHHGSVPSANSFWLAIANISDETQPYIQKRIEFPNAVDQMFIQGDRLYMNCGGLRIFDISDPLNPVQIGYWSGSTGEMLYLGDHIFFGTWGNGVICLNITDPANMYVDAQPNYGHYNEYEGTVTGNGRFIYIGTVSDESQIPTGGTKESNLHALEVFDQDPDDTGPGKWSAMSLGEPSWDLQYEANSLPTASSPAWNLLEGSEAWASVTGGILRINDTGTVSGDKIKWSRFWDATNTRGSTVLVRAKCQSSNGFTSIPNIIIEDGKYTEEFAILPNQIRANNSGLQYTLDGTSWHTYRITTKGSQFKVYVDENAAPAITGTLLVTTNRARITFGSGSSPATQDISFDYMHCFSNGAFAPGTALPDHTIDITVNVADTAGKGSLSGINPATARVEWSTDGGVTWNSSGGMLWNCLHTGDSMPTATTPRWMVADGSESWGSIVSGSVRVNDTSIASGSKIKWARRWKVTPSTGATVVTRARCVSAGGDNTWLGNIYLDDGVHLERLKILPDRIQLGESGLVYSLDGTQWHTYRITINGNTIRVYVDEGAAPVLTGPLTSSTEGRGPRVMFGSGASAATQEIYFDSISYAETELLPGQGDAGSSFLVFCSASFGSDRGSISASGIPFNQTSDHLNKVRFSVQDVEGNTGRSPVYNVRILDPANATPEAVTGLAAVPGPVKMTLNWTNPASSSFTGTMIRYRTDRYPLTPTDGTLVVDKPNSPGSTDSYIHTNLIAGTTYYYAAFAHNYIPNFAAGTNTSAKAQPLEATIAEAKALPNGEMRTLRGNVVSAVFSGSFYIQDLDDWCGIKAISAYSVNVGQKVDVTGTIGGQGFLRTIDCSTGSVSITDYSPIAVDPVGIGCPSLGGAALNGYTPGVWEGSGTNNLGLLVTVWGEVTATGSGFFYISDGSPVADTRIDPATGKPYKGIRVITTAANPSLGEYWAVTGISSYTIVGPNKIRAILPRGAGDMIKLKPVP